MSNIGTGSVRPSAGGVELLAYALACVLACMPAVGGCAKGGSYDARTRDRPTLLDRVAHDWSRVLGEGRVRGTDLGALPDGMLLVGELSGRARLADDVVLEAEALSDGFVARLDWQGQVRWASALSGAGAEQVSAQAADDAGRVAVAVSAFEDTPVTIAGKPVRTQGRPGAVIALLDPAGGVLASVPLQSDRHLRVAALASARTAEGRSVVVAAGQFSGTMRAGNHVFTSEGASDLFMVCMNWRGDVVWARRHGGKGPDVAFDMAAAGQRLVVAGAFSGRARLGDRDVHAVPAPGRRPRPGQDAFVAAVRVDDGALAWLKTLGGPAPDSALAVALAPGDTAYVAGVFSRLAQVKLRRLEAPGQEDDVFVMALDEGGGIIWSRVYGGPGRDHPLAMTASADGVVVAGTFEHELVVDGQRLASAGAHDIFALALSPAGELRWARRFGGPGHDAPAAMARAPDGAVVVTGTFTGQADLGGDIPLDAGGESGSSGFLMRIR